MTAPSRLQLFDTKRGDVAIDQSQMGAIGTAMGNGAANAASIANAGVVSMGSCGNLSVITAQPGSNPASTGTDVVLAIYTLPASCLDVAGRLLEITACGNALNATSKNVKLIVGAINPIVGQTVSGGTTLATTGAITNNGGWMLSAEIVKYGAVGSNTQQAIHTAAQVGSVVSALQAPSGLTLNESAPITICVTGNAATLATDLVFNSLQVMGMN